MGSSALMWAMARPHPEPGPPPEVVFLVGVRRRVPAGSRPPVGGLFPRVLVVDLGEALPRRRRLPVGEDLRDGVLGIRPPRAGFRVPHARHPEVSHVRRSASSPPAFRPAWIRRPRFRVPRFSTSSIRSSSMPQRPLLAPHRSGTPAGPARPRRRPPALGSIPAQPARRAPTVPGARVILGVLSCGVRISLGPRDRRAVDHDQDAAERLVVDSRRREPAVVPGGDPHPAPDHDRG